MTSNTDGAVGYCLEHGGTTQGCCHKCEERAAMSQRGAPIDNSLTPKIGAATLRTVKEVLRKIRG